MPLKFPLSSFGRRKPKGLKRQALSFVEVLFLLLTLVTLIIVYVGVRQTYNNSAADGGRSFRIGGAGGDTIA